MASEVTIKPFLIFTEISEDLKNLLTAWIQVN
jgi:hypothetical protein